MKTDLIRVEVSFWACVILTNLTTGHEAWFWVILATIPFSAIIYHNFKIWKDANNKPQS